MAPSIGWQGDPPPCVFLFSRCCSTAVLTHHSFWGKTRGRKAAQGLGFKPQFEKKNKQNFSGVMNFSLSYHKGMPCHVAHPFLTDPTSHACDEDQANLVWCAPADRRSVWLAKIHNRPPRPNPVAPKPTNQQTGDHMLPAPVMRVSVSPRPFCQPLFWLQSGFMKGFKPTHPC